MRELNEEIEEVGVTLEKQKILRDEISESQIQEFGEEILKIQEMLSQQREERIHNNNLLMEEIEEMDEALERAISVRVGLGRGRERPGRRRKRCSRHY